MASVSPKKLSRDKFSPVKLVPALTAIAVVAVGLRVADIYAGVVGPFSPAVFAAEDEAPAKAPQEKPSEDEKPEGDAQDGGGAAGNEPNVDTGPLDFNSFETCTEEDIRLIEQLKQRRVFLDQREQELEIRESLLEATEKRIADSTNELSVLEQQIKAHLKLFDEREQKQLERVVQVYSTMKPKDAAPRFEALDLGIQVDLATVMEPRKVSDIIAKMNPNKAVALTQALATIASAPTIDDIQGSGASR